MAYKVKAPLVLLAGVPTPHAYQGRVIKEIPHAKQREHLLKLGFVEEVPDASEEAPAAVAALPDQPAVNDRLPIERPAPTASKETWVAYIVATGVASTQEAQGMTKDQLIGLAG